MEQWRGYPVQVEQVHVGGRVYALLVPANSAVLLDDPAVVARFAADEYMPYWAALWPGALLLADVVAAWGPAPPAGAPSVLELGAGLGLVGLVAAELGFSVTVSDYDEDALAFARENARRNGVAAPATRHVDWRQTYDDLRPDRILAADVLYEARNLEPIARFIRNHLAPGGFALLSDANRSTADPLPRIAAGFGLAVEVTTVERPGEDPARPGRGRIFHLWRAAGP